MKFLSKITFAVLAIGLTVALSSCSKDDDKCAKCDAYTFDDGMGTTIDFPALNVCEGDDDGLGGTLTAADIDALVDGYETGGSNCD